MHTSNADTGPAELGECKLLLLVISDLQQPQEPTVSLSEN